MNVQLPPKIDIARKPTPIEKFDSGFPGIEDYEIYIKRDDLTGSILQGNKIRKMEYVIADCDAKDADIILTCGGLQSNHCRCVACLAAMRGLKSLLFLRGAQPEIPMGNYLIDRIVGAGIKYVTPQEYFDINYIMESEARKLKSEGMVPYVVPEGASNALGVCGYFDCYEEILSQSNEQNFEFDYIVTAVGSAGTYSGLLAGAKYHDSATRIAGINVCYTSDHFEDKIHSLLIEFKRRYIPELKVDWGDISVYDGYVGPGYALSTDNQLDFIITTARRTGLVLDPVYTGKAFYGMIDLLRKKLIPKGSRILFMHTGGLWGLTPAGEKMMKLGRF